MQRCLLSPHFLRIPGAKKGDKVAICLRLVIRGEHILLATLALLTLTKTSIVMYYEAKDPRVTRRGFRVPHGMEEPVGLLTPVLEAFFSNVSRLGSFKIVSNLHFGAVEASLAFQRSREVDWSRCVMD